MLIYRCMVICKLKRAQFEFKQTQAKKKQPILRITTTLVARDKKREHARAGKRAIKLTNNY